MSRENVKKLFEEIEKNPQLKEKYLAAMREYQKESEKVLTGKMIEIGKSSGFSFTDADLHETRAEFLDALNSNNEMNDSDLESVVGGRGDLFDKKTRGVIASLTLFGLGCAIQSIYQEVQGPGRCGAHLSTTQKC
jgi:predicted ribosomally synthesized peptide with nif11-like leader